MTAALVLLSALVATGPRFRDDTVALGLPAVRTVSMDGDYTGIGVVDWDGDLWPDLVIPGKAGTTALYQNGGPPDFLFHDVSEEAGLREPGVSAIGVVAADFTGDGIEDIFLLAPTEHEPPALLVGTPEGRYVNETALRFQVPWARYAGLRAADIDGDGDLDLALSRWSQRGPATLRECHEGHLFENDHGVFKWRQADTEKLAGCGHAAAFTDFDDDGDADYVQVNDYGPVFLPTRVLRNDGLDAAGRWVLTDISDKTALGQKVYGMGFAVGDVNGDLIRDYHLSSVGEDLLLIGQPDGSFQDQTDLWGVGEVLGAAGRRWKWDTVLRDFDNDGALDLAVTTGQESSQIPGNDPHQANLLMVGHGAPPFEDASAISGVAFESSDRGLAVLDIDRDGRLDMVVAGMDGIRLLRNVTEDAGHYIAFELVGTVGPREPVAAKVIARCGDREFLVEYAGGGTPGAHHQFLGHVGLGACAGPVDLTIRWPGGWRQVVSGLAADTTHRIEEPEWLTVSARSVAPGEPVLVTYQHDTEGPASVGITTTAGAVDAPLMTSLGNGTYQATLTSLENAEATLSFSVDGRDLSVHPRVVFGPQETIQWGRWPLRAYAGQSLRIGVRVVDRDGLPVDGTPNLEVTGAKVLGSRMVAGGLVLETRVLETAVQVVVRPTLDGASIGGPQVIAMADRASAKRSFIVVRPAYLTGDEDVVKIHVEPNTYTGVDAIDLEALVDDVELTLDGRVLAAPYASDGLGISAWMPVAELGFGTLQASVKGVPIAGTVQIRSIDAARASAVSQETSYCSFFDRHLHADGEDVIPIWFVLRNDQDQDVPVDDTARIGYQTQGVEALPGTTLVAEGDESVSFFAFFKVTGAAGEVARVAVTLDGEPTGLVAEAPLVTPVPVRPALSQTTVVCRDLPDGAVCPADGRTLPISVIPRDASGNRTGSGAALTVAAAGVAFSPVAYVGYGEYVVFARVPTAACNAEVVVGSGVVEAVGRIALSFGEHPSGPCGAADEGCSAAPRPGRSGALWWVGLCLMGLGALRWRRGRSAHR